LEWQRGFAKRWQQRPIGPTKLVSQALGASSTAGIAGLPTVGMASQNTFELGAGKSSLGD
jgi:hypothetical protein